MKRTGKTLIKLAVCICAVAVIGFWALTFINADEQMAKDNKWSMDKCAIKCAKVCDKNLAAIPSAMAALDEAIKKIDAGDTVAAKAEIEKAKKELADMKKGIEKCLEQMPVVNEKCPVTGKPIDRENVPAELTKMYKGMKVGFCCPACPPAWEKLTDEEKDAKLKEIMPKPKEKTKQ